MVRACTHAHSRRCDHLRSHACCAPGQSGKDDSVLRSVAAAFRQDLVRARSLRAEPRLLLALAVASQPCTQGGLSVPARCLSSAAVCCCVMLCAAVPKKSGATSCLLELPGLTFRTPAGSTSSRRCWSG